MQGMRSSADWAGFRSDDVRRYDDCGISIYDSTFTWESGAEMIGQYDRVELHYRLSPARVLARVRTEASAEHALGRLLVIPPLDFKARAGDQPETVHTISCHFDRTWLEDLVGAELNWDPHNVSAYFDLNDSHVETSMRRIARELGGGEPGRNGMITALCHSIGIDIARRFGLSRGRSTDLVDTIACIRLQSIKSMIVDATDRIPSIADISERSGLSASMLRQLFRQGCGQTLQEFLDDARLSMAQRLLLETRLPLKMIAFRAGYAHHSAFTHAFRRRMGLSPRDYRMTSFQ